MFHLLSLLIGRPSLMGLLKKIYWRLCHKLILAFVLYCPWLLFQALQQQKPLLIFVLCAARSLRGETFEACKSAHLAMCTSERSFALPNNAVDKAMAAHSEAQPLAGGLFSMKRATLKGPFSAAFNPIQPPFVSEKKVYYMYV